MNSETKLPAEILMINQWTCSYSISELKRPKQSHYTPRGSMSYTQAKLAAGDHLLMGFYVTEEDPYILGDIDHIDNPHDREYIAQNLPMGMANLLLNKKIYSEVSPSGKGIRFIAKFASKDIKQLFQEGTSYFKNRVKMTRDQEAQIHIGSPWNTITGDRTPYSSDVVSVLNIEDLEELFKLKLRGRQETSYVEGPPPDIANGPFPILDETLSALRSLPQDQNPRIQRAFKAVFNEEFTNYEYWLKVIMGLSDYASKSANESDKLTCLDEVCVWSALDVEGFTSNADVIAKWNSLQRSEHKVSYHTLFALAHHNQLRFPMPKILSKKQRESGISKRGPMVSEFINFEALINYYNIKLYRDSTAYQKLYLTGDTDILDKFFKYMDIKVYHGKYYGVFSEKNLISLVHRLCQDHGFVSMTRTAVIQNINIWRAQLSREVDLVRMYFDTPWHRLPKEYKENEKYFDLSSPEYMFGCLEIGYLTPDTNAEKALYFKYYKSWLMGIARNIFFPNTEHMNNCILILTGPEQIRKTSHFKYMLPKFMREDRIAFTTHGFATEAAIRDVTKLASSNTLIVWDEIEQYLTPDTESNFKKLIDNNPVKVIDKYETVESYIKPIAIYGATSNQRTFKLSDNGSRRLFIIPVTWVDTDKLNTVNWWKIVNELKHQIEQSKTPPWLLDDEELEQQTMLHTKISAKSSLDIILEEMYDFFDPFPIEPEEDELDQFNFYDNPDLITLRTLSRDLNQHLGVGSHNFSRPVMINSLKRMCGKWTGTIRTTRTFINPPSLRIIKGEVFYNGRSKFWVPPKRGDV